MGYVHLGHLLLLLVRFNQVLIEEDFIGFFGIHVALFCFFFVILAIVLPPLSIFVEVL